jgi:solute:Na+ symporter, SSS family
MIAAFAAAYMSTIGTQLNWGASYVINDFYRRFLVRDGSERHYVVASQVVTLLLMIVSIVVTYYLGSIKGAWKLLLVTGAGTGTVLLLRWYWWRINAWSEVSAMITAAAVSLYLQTAPSAKIAHLLPAEYATPWNNDDPKQFAYLMLTTVALTTVVWLIVTMLTRPEPRDKLVIFYRLVRPAGPGWGPVAAAAGPLDAPSESLTLQFVNWLAGCVLIYGTLFGIGKLIFKEWTAAGAYLIAAAVAAAIISRNLSQADWEAGNSQ